MQHTVLAALFIIDDKLHSNFCATGQVRVRRFSAIARMSRGDLFTGSLPGASLNQARYGPDTGQKRL